MVVLPARYGGETEPVCPQVAQGETGISVFDTTEDAQEGLAEAYRGLLGSGYWRHRSCRITRWRSSFYRTCADNPST